MSRRQAAVTGSFPGGMEFLTWGSGPRSLLFIQGGPGSALPSGMMARLSRRWFDPFVEAGYVVWVVTRRRNMPRGHTVADMAGDFADMISTQFDGSVDLLVGESYGGMIGQHLAARTDVSFGHVALVVSGAEVSDWGKEVDSRLAAAVARGDRVQTGMAFSEYLLPGERTRWLRRVAGPWLGRSLLSGRSYPVSDLLVEVEAEISFDARPQLPRVRVPVVLVCGDRDLFFPREVVEETASLIPDSTVVWYPGKGHVKVASSSRVAHDVLAFVHRA